MSRLLEKQEYQDIFRLIENGWGEKISRSLHLPQLFYVHIGTIRKYLEDAYWRGMPDDKIIETVKKDILNKRENVLSEGCFLIIDFDGCGIFNKTLLGLCPKIVKLIIKDWIDVVWGSYIIRPNTFTAYFLNLIMVFIPRDKHDKITLVKGGLLELVLSLDKLGRSVEEKQWIRMKLSGGNLG